MGLLGARSQKKAARRQAQAIEYAARKQAQTLKEIAAPWQQAGLEGIAGLQSAIRNLLAPEVIVLGGGLLEKLGNLFLKEAERSMREHAMESLVAGTKVVLATLGDDAVPIGAAALARGAHEGA